MVSVAQMDIAMQTLKDGLTELRAEFSGAVNTIEANVNALDGKVNATASNVIRESETFATKVKETVLNLDQSRARIDEQMNVMATRAEAFRKDAAELQNKVDADFQKMVRAQEENAARQQQAQEAMRQTTEATFSDIQAKCKTFIGGPVQAYSRIREYGGQERESPRRWDRIYGCRPSTSHWSCERARASTSARI